jgi:hypothetical protein
MNIPKRHSLCHQPSCPRDRSQIHLVLHGPQDHPNRHDLTKGYERGPSANEQKATQHDELTHRHSSSHWAQTKDHRSKTRPRIPSYQSSIRREVPILMAQL